MVAGGPRWGGEKWVNGEGESKGQASTYKIGPGDVMFSMVTIVNDTV